MVTLNAQTSNQQVMQLQQELERERAAADSHNGSAADAEMVANLKNEVSKRQRELKKAEENVKILENSISGMSLCL